MKKLLPILLILLAGCSDKPTSPYIISKVIKIMGGAKFDVQVYGRLTKPQLIGIASKIKKDSAQYDNLEIDYLLPGNSYKNSGGITVYATAEYHDKRKITALDTVKDLHDNSLSFKFTGFTPEEARHILSFDPKEMAGKTLLGKFIDDFTQTVSVVYKDDRQEGQIFILELDTTGKVVSATEPMMVSNKGVQKLVVSPKGDYCTLDNGTFTMYNIDEPDKPYRVLKEGI